MNDNNEVTAEQKVRSHGAVRNQAELEAIFGVPSPNNPLGLGVQSVMSKDDELEKIDVELRRRMVAAADAMQITFDDMWCYLKILGVDVTSDGALSILTSKLARESDARKVFCYQVGKKNWHSMPPPVGLVAFGVGWRILKGLKVE